MNQPFDQEVHEAEQTMVVSGNPAIGFSYIGPFSTYEQAVEWATHNYTKGSDWWVVTLNKP